MCIGKWVGLQSNILSLLWQEAMVFKSSGKCNEYFFKENIILELPESIMCGKIPHSFKLFFYFSKDLAFLHILLLGGGGGVGGDYVSLPLFLTS